MQYRRDIDGLRAVAVLSVLLYHAGVNPFSGGFVGVDVFFVISGFLITSLLRRDYEENEFSIPRFYERRIRRIIPALVMMSAAVWMVAYFILLPWDFKDFSESLAASSIFLSNVFFEMKAGYFAAPSEYKPLLHTWSLSVEEQFYVLFPLLLWFVQRYFGRHVFAVLCVLLIASFAYSLHAVQSKPAAAFFLAPSRGWELVLGALLAINCLPALRSETISNVLSAAGFALIAWAVFAFSPDTPFPGINAMFPALGTALLIYANTHVQSGVARALSRQPIVAVGLISYSLYLWHWPIIVLTKYQLQRPLAGIEIAVLIILTIAISAASWRLVEQPFRRRNGVLARPGLFTAWASVTCVLAIAGLTGHWLRGMPQRWPEAVAQYDLGRGDENPDRSRCTSLSPDQIAQNELCILGPATHAKSFLVWGDFHADAMMPGLKLAAQQEGIAGWFAADVGCAPIWLSSPDAKPTACQRFNDAVLAFIRRSSPKAVILIARWSQLPIGILRERLGVLIKAIGSTGAEVWMVEEVPKPDHSVPVILAKAAMSNADSTDLGPSYLAFVDQQRGVRAVFADFAAKGVHLLDPSSAMCTSGQCVIEAQGHSLYYDDNHLSAFGASWLAPVFRRMFSEIHQKP